MVNAATEYRKNGFNDQDAAQLARVSSMFQNVADESISTGDAAQFLISQLIAFNQNTGDVAGNAMHIADALNEVANNFAVGTGDLATGLKVVASSSAGMNNSFEQTIGLMTAITEQTKNASKASRGLNAIMANLAQVLDPASSNGKKIVQIFNDLGASMYDTNGQLKSGFDLLQGLYSEWGNLDSNTQKYIATTIAGTTQLNNFLALMNNFDHAVGATNKALESQGSAMRENSAYMESIQAKLSQLQSTFQDFANNVISSDLAKAVLDLANGLLQIANTDLGQIVTQIVLLTGLGWGATSLTKALGIFKVGIEQFKILGQVAGAAGAAGGITSVADAFAALSLAGGAALPIILGVATALAVGGALWKATEDSRKSFEELKTEIDNVNDNLQTNKERLKEINNLPWNERTQEILDEKEALEKENDELQAQIDKLETLSEKKAKQALSGGYVTGERIQVAGITGQYAGRFDAGLQGQSFETYEELVKYLDNYIPGASKKTRQELEELGVSFETVQGQVYKTGEAYEQDLIKQANELSDKLKTNHQLTDDDLEQYNEVTSKLNTLAQAHQIVGDNSTVARETLDGLNSSYKNAVEYTQKYGEASTESSRKVTDLVNSLAVAASQSGKTEAAFYQLVASGKVFNNTSLNVSEKIAALQQLAAQAGITATLLTASSTATHDQMSGYIRTQKMKGMSESQATQSYLQSIYKEFMSFTPTVPTSLKPPGGGGTKTGTKTSTKTTKKDTILESYKERVNVLKSELALMQERGDNEEAQVAKMRQIQDALHQQAEYMRKVGSSEADINALSQEHWQYTKKINELYKQRLETQKELAEKQKDELNTQKEQVDKEYQLISKYAQYVADEQIALLDKQIEALEQVNDELDKQAQKEKYLQDLATAKSKRLYVFKDGRFQYVEDVDAVSQAESELAEYEREQALESQKESLESQKKMWEDYKDGWSNLTSEYEIEQGRLLYLQKYGTSIEQQTWNTRLSNLASFKSSYLKQIEEIEAALAKLQALQVALDAKQWAISGQDWKPGYNAGVNVSAGGINKDYVDVLGYDPTTDYSALKKERGYLTPEQEQQRQNKINDMYGGKDPYQGGSSSGGSSGSSSSSKDRKSTAQSALEKSKQTGQKVSLGGGVSIDYSKINKHAEGTLGTSGGLSLVGEQGPELRVLGQGDGVLPSDITRNLWDWGKINPNNIGGNTTHIFNIDNLTLPNVNDAKSLVAGLKNLAYQRAYKRA